MEDHKSDFISNQASFDEDFDRIRALVRKDQVYWEVLPEYHIDREGKRIQIGFELNLIATHGHSEEIIEPGCLECIKIYEDLTQIADWIIPKGERDSLYEIGFFDASIHYSSRRRFRPEVILTIQILHREGFDHPTDAHDVQEVNEVEEKLKALGADKG